MKCTIHAYSTALHVSQLYTGFSLLARNGEINLKQRLSNYSHKGKPCMAHLGPHALNGLFVELNDDKVLFYDTSDRCDLYEEALEVSDFYFKRSYLPSAVQAGYTSAVFPLGLNYPLYSGTLCRYEWARFLGRTDVFNNFPRGLLTRIAELASIKFLPRATSMYATPNPDQEPRVLFIARAWDPDNDPVGLSAERKADRRQINEMRARCLTLLKKELGSRFYGGFIRTDYAMDHFKDLLLENVSISKQRSYISLLHDYPICIATTGLHGSIGWKMGEYVSFSKSIVSERLGYVVPGGFEKDRNYLEFDTPSLCLEQAMRLVEDKHCRQQMLDANWHYYREHLSPDRLILRTLKIASDF